MGRSVNNQKGKLASVTSAGDITVELATRSAVRLWHGRETTEKRRGIIGMAGFGRLLRTVEQSIKEDDPYADCFYAKIESAIADLSDDLDADMKAMDDLIESGIPAEMTVPKVVNEEPVVVPVKFSSSLGFKLVYQLIKADKIALKVLQASHLGLLDGNDKLVYLSNNERKIRAVMNRVFDFKYTGVTRDDVAANNPKAQKADNLMGKISEGYMTGELRSPNAPKPPRRRRQAIEKNDTEAGEGRAVDSAGDVLATA